MSSDIYVTRNGRNLGFLPYCDYVFVFSEGFNSNDVASVETIHQKVRDFVNAQYKWPKTFRIKVPNMASIFISYNGFSEDIKLMAQKRTRTLVGGEFHSMFLIDLQNLEVVGQGISYTSVSGAKMNFKKVDPQNRMFYLIHNLANHIFKNKMKYTG